MNSKTTLQPFKVDLSELENSPIEKITNSPHILIFLHNCKINTVGELLQMPLSKLIGLAKNNNGKQIIVEITDIITDIIENQASDKHDTRNDISEAHDINQKIMSNNSSNNLIECLSKSTTTEALIPELGVSNKTEDNQTSSQQPSIPDNEMCTSSISRLATKLGVPKDIGTPNSN